MLGNRTGENPLWDSEEPYYDSFYCIWDSFRSVHPLLTILDPKSQTKMVRALIDIYRHEGKSNSNGLQKFILIVWQDIFLIVECLFAKDSLRVDRMLILYWRTLL